MKGEYCSLDEERLAVTLLDMGRRESRLFRGRGPAMQDTAGAISVLMSSSGTWLWWNAKKQWGDDIFGSVRSRVATAVRHWSLQH